MVPPTRRGRPTSLGYGNATGLWPRVPPGQLAAWLLKMWRLYGDTDILTVRQLAAAVRTPPVDDATVSRWENSRATVPTPVLHRYEQLFGVPRGELTAVMTALGQARPGGRRTAKPCDELLGKCLDRDVVTAAEWVDLAVSLTHSRRRLPRPIWDELAHRLLTEMCLSVGWRYLLRLSALTVVHRHPNGGPALVAATEDFLADPACQLIIDPVALLATSPIPDTSRRLATYLSEPRSEAEQLGALFAWSARPPRDLGTARRLENVTRELFTGASAAPAIRQAAGDLLAVLPGCGPNRPPARMASPGRAGEAAFSVLRRSLATAQNRHHHLDLIGPSVLRQALFSTDSDLRILTVNVLHASPFRDVLADTLATLLTSGLTRHSAAVHAALVDLVGSLGRARHRPVVENVLQQGVTQEAAAVALAHLPGRTDLRLWHHVLATRPASGSLQRATLYAVGMNRDHDGLRLLQAQTPAVRDRANWWLRLPAAASAAAPC